MARMGVEGVRGGAAVAIVVDNEQHTKLEGEYNASRASVASRGQVAFLRVSPRQAPNSQRHAHLLGRPLPNEIAT